MPTEPPFDEAAEPQRLREFIDDIEANGFKRTGPTSWAGPVRSSLIDGGHTDSEEMSIIVRPSWPYLPPLIHVPGIAAWHADRERLCIWQADDNSQRWVSLAGIYDRIDEWAAQADTGFADVENARNPEIYWQDDSPRVAALVDLDELVGPLCPDGEHGEFNFADAVSNDGRHSPNVFDLGRGEFRRSSRLPVGVDSHLQVRGRWLFRDSVPHPPRTLDELRGFLTETQRERLDRDLSKRPIVMFGLVWPNQAGLVATMLLSLRDQAGDRSYALVILRPKGREALLLRAGPDARTLQLQKVAILGTGAIGSHVAEQLVRAGVGRLLLFDYDDLWPANLIRHAAPPGTPAAMPKTLALQQHLQQYPWVKVEIPTSQLDGCVWTPSQLRSIVNSVDLTIDATGHGGLAELTARIAHEEGAAFVSVALFRGGAVARVRRQAIVTDTPILQRPLLDPYPNIPPLDEEIEYAGTETGCLARIHNAPPVAVAHAAVIATEVAIDNLTARHHQPDEIIEVLRIGEPPLHRIGRVRAEDLPKSVDITERASRELRRAATGALPSETGGILLGVIVDGRPVVCEVVEVRDLAATDRSYQIAADLTGDLVVVARQADARLGYLGDWHSHTTDTGPSLVDEATMIRSSRSGDREDPVLVLVHPNSQWPDDVHAYTATTAGLKRSRICVTGELPPDDTELT